MRSYLTNLTVPVLLTLFLAPLAYIAAKPDRPKVPIPKNAALPDLNMKSNWGVVSQCGADKRTVQIDQHPNWTAFGKIRSDGKIEVTWTLITDGRSGPGVYEWDGKELNGRWGYAGSAEVGEDGQLAGNTYPDRIYRVE